MQEFEEKKIEFLKIFKCGHLCYRILENVDTAAKIKLCPAYASENTLAS